MINKFCQDKEALNILLDYDEKIKCIQEKNSCIQKYFSHKKVRNIRLRKKNLDKIFKSVLCSRFENKSEISGLVLAIYKDSSGKKIF